jgi:hypothetical protein
LKIIKIKDVNKKVVPKEKKKKYNHSFYANHKYFSHPYYVNKKNKLISFVDQLNFN